MKIVPNHLSFKKSSIDLRYDHSRRRPEHARYMVSGSMYMMFQVCRFCGIAPVRFENQFDSLYVRVSPAVSAICYFIFAVLTTAAFIGLVVDILAPQDTSVRARTAIRGFVWTCDYLIVFLNMGAAVYRAPGRVDEIIRCLNQVQKVKSELYVSSNKKQEQNRFAAIIVFVTTATLILGVDYSDFLGEMLKARRNISITAIYAIYYMAYMVMFVMEFQFVFVALEVQRAFKSLNDMLMKVEQLIKKRNSKVLLSNNYVTMVPANMISQLVDCMKTGDGASMDEGFKTTKSPSETIGHLVMTYDRLCSVVRRLNECFGLELAVLMTSCMLHLIITPYNLISTIEDLATSDVTSLVMQMVWCAWHLFRTCAAVESCHATKYEMNRTCWLVSHYMLHNTDDQVQIELEKFSRLLFLNEASYSPMGAFTLSRSLVVSMVGSVATYLVIIIQFDIY